MSKPLWWSTSGASREEVAQALYLLERSRVHGPLARELRHVILEAAHRAEESPPSLITRIGTALGGGYGRLIRWHWFQRVALALFIIYAILFLGGALTVLLQQGPALPFFEDQRSAVALGYLISALVSSLLVAFGVVRLPASRLAAYRWFKRGILVSIFFGQFFLFYENQLGAIGGLVVNLVLLSGLNYMIGEEEFSCQERGLPTREDAA